MAIVVVALATSGVGLKAQPAAGAEILAELLIELLSDDPDDHRAALERVVALGSSAVPTLEQLAVDSSAHPRHRAGAIYALGVIGAPTSLTVLEMLWESGLEALGGELAIQVATALADFDELGALRSILEMNNEILGAKAAIQLALRRDRGSAARIGEMRDDPVYERMTPFLAISLGLLGDSSAVEVLRSIVSVPELRNHSAVALAQLGLAGDVRFELEFALSDPDPLVRLRALEALITLEPARLDRILEQASADADARVREAAGAAMERRDRRRR